MQVGKARDHGAQMGPFARVADQTPAPRVVQYVKAGGGKRPAPTVLLAQDAIVRLLLQFKFDALRGPAGEFAGRR